MNLPDEQLKFQQFKKMSHSLSRHNKIPLEKQLEHITQDLKYYTTKIIENCKTHNDAELEKTIEKVIKLFAKRTAIQIAQDRESFGSASDDMIEDEINSYGIACARFLDTVDAMNHLATS
ncbi:MAG: hypothetical protein HYV41_04040 [Candidatus Magasanikbacteria bacterium]|nr:hypothetical protein [Candidatus Magasanikbacteria bacterium]